MKRTFALAASAALSAALVLTTASAATAAPPPAPAVAASSVTAPADRLAVRAVARKFLTLVSDANRAKATLADLAPLGLTEEVLSDQAKYTAFIRSSEFRQNEKALVAAIANHYAGAENLAYSSDYPVGDTRNAAATGMLAITLMQPAYEMAKIPDAAVLIGSANGWAVGKTTAALYNQDLAAKYRVKGSTVPVFKFVKKSGNWYLDLNKIVFSTYNEKITPFRATAAGWRPKSVKIKRGKAPRTQKVTVSAATGKLVLERKVGKKWQKVTTVKVNSTNGRTTVRFPRLRTKGKYQFRIRLTGTPYYTLKGAKALTVTVR